MWGQKGHHGQHRLEDAQPGAYRPSLPQPAASDAVTVILPVLEGDVIMPGVVGVARVAPMAG